MSCTYCGAPAEATCTACDAELCDEHGRTTSVPGDTFCADQEACAERQAS